MALGQVASVAQLVGVDVGGLISMIMQAAVTACQNKKECEQLARRVMMIADLLPHLEDPEVLRRPEVRRPLEGLGDTLREAHELVTSCQGRSAVYRFFMAGRQAERFRDVQSRIDSYLLVFPFISHIDITRRLDRIYSVLVSDNTSMESVVSNLESEKVTRFMLHGDGTRLFTQAEMLAATINFAGDNLIAVGGFGRVYKGMLLDGREVAIKRMGGDHKLHEFHNEIWMLSSLRHDNIARLLGWSGQKEVEEHTLVFEYMKNDTLSRHLHAAMSPSSPSPMRASWRTRIEILLGVSRAIEYLHCHAVPPVIHGDVKPSNVLLDASWVPRLSDFGGATTYDGANKTKRGRVYGTVGYVDPEFYSTGCLTPRSDVYSFGVLMLEVLTGKRPSNENWSVADELEKPGLVIWALSLIGAGEFGKVLDRRPELAEPTPRQLEAAGVVARMAASCLQMRGEDRPSISDVVAKLVAAVELVRGQI